jgi:hypothetical protein
MEDFKEVQKDKMEDDIERWLCQSEKKLFRTYSEEYKIENER